MRIFVRSAVAPRTLDLSFADTNVTVAQVKRAISDLEGVPADLQRICTGTGDLCDDYALSGIATEVHGLRCLLRLAGGKGGFGAQLRTARGGLETKPTTNFEACRDLNGRRMRHVNNEKAVKDWMANSKQRSAERDELKAQQKAKQPKWSFDDNSYAKQVESVRDAVGNGVAAGIVAAKKLALQETAKRKALAGEREIRGSGGSLEPPGPLPTHLRTVIWGMLSAFLPT
jgi:hypothetical protein